MSVEKEHNGTVYEYQIQWSDLTTTTITCTEDQIDDYIAVMMENANDPVIPLTIKKL